MGTWKYVVHIRVRVQARHCDHMKMCNAPRIESAG